MNTNTDERDRHHRGDRERHHHFGLTFLPGILVLSYLICFPFVTRNILRRQKTAEMKIGFCAFLTISVTLCWVTCLDSRLLHSSFLKVKLEEILITLQYSGGQETVVAYVTFRQ